MERMLCFCSDKPPTSHYHEIIYDFSSEKIGRVVFRCYCERKYSQSAGMCVICAVTALRACKMTVSRATLATVSEEGSAEPQAH